MKKIAVVLFFLLSSCNNYIDVAELRTLDTDSLIVDIRGVVSGVFQEKNQIGGFYIQDSRYFYKQSIFVNSRENVSVGDQVLLKGKVVNQKNETQLDDVQLIEIISNNHFIKVEKISFPISNKQLEELEACLIEINDEIQISDSYQFNKYGQLLLANSKLVHATEELDAQDKAIEIDDLILQQHENSIIVDDLSDMKFPKLNSLYIDPLKVVSGNRISSIKGFVAQYKDDYKIRLIDDINVLNTVEKDSINFNSGIRIMSFNLHNLFNGHGDKEGFPTERGAKTYNEYILQMEKLASAIYAVDPDILAMMELENDGEDEFSSIQQFCDYLNLNGNRNYKFEPSFGKVGEDLIKTGIIYDPNVVDAIQKPKYHDNAIFSRPPLFQKFSYRDSIEFVISVNHFKSKSSRNAIGLDIDQKDGQASYNNKRNFQAEALLSIIDSLYLDEHILVLGDFNSYTKEDPIQTLESSNLSRLKTDVHSYLYKGKMGNLDHVFVSDNFRNRIEEVKTWNINAIYPNWIDYRHQFADSSYYRSSDHNPIIIIIN